MIYIYNKMKNILDTIYTSIGCDETYKVDEEFYKNVKAGTVTPEDIQQIIPIERPGCDCVGRKISVGDWVIFAPAGTKSGGLQLGFVISANKRINLKTIAHHTGWQSWNRNPVETLVVPGHRCVKVMDKDDFMKSVTAEMTPEDQQCLQDVVKVKNNN